MFKYQRDKMFKEHPFYTGVDPEVFEKSKRDKRYVALMSSMSHTYGNALAFMQNYIINLFPKDLFKTIHVNSKIAHRQIRTTPYEYTRKNKPIIIFRPRIGDINDDRFLKGTPMIERMTDLYSTYGMTNLLPLFEDPSKDLAVKFQLNRNVFYVDVVLIFSTLMQQIDYMHYIQNAVRINHNFNLETFLESYIPQEMLKIISDITGVPLYDAHGSTKEFLSYMSGHSVYPITYKLQGSTGTREFYRYYPCNIDTIITDLTSDDGERFGHVTSDYKISFSVRMEFNSTGFYYLFSDHLFSDYTNLPTTYPEDTTIIPVFTDVVLKEDLNLRRGWRLYNSASCRLEDKDDVTINIDELLNDSIRKVIEYHKNNGMPYIEFLDIKIRKQGVIIHEGEDYTINYDTMDVTFNNPDTYYTYKFLICINVEYINDFIKDIFNLE